MRKTGIKNKKPSKQAVVDLANALIMYHGTTATWLIKEIKGTTEAYKLATTFKQMEQTCLIRTNSIKEQ